MGVVQDIFSQKRKEREAFVERKKEAVARVTDRIVEFLEPENLRVALKNVPPRNGSIYVEIPNTCLDDRELAHRAIRGVPGEVLEAAGGARLSGWSSGVVAHWDI